MGIQALRGLAAIMVTIYHYTLFWTVDYRGPHGTTIWEQGASGVDIFFLISGFVMTISTTGAKVPTAFEFTRRRIVRIVPLYWLVTLIIGFKRIYLYIHPALHSPLSSRAVEPAISLQYLLSCLFFIPARDADGLVLPIVTPGWTLDLEMFFYLLFAIALLLKIKPVRFLTPAMLFLVAFGTTGLISRFALSAFTSPILLEFLAGVLVAHAMLGGFRIGLRLAALLGVAGCAAITTVSFGNFSFARTLEWGIPALCILIATVMIEERCGQLWPTFILKVGDASYSLYLIHIMMLGPLLRISRKIHGSGAHEGLFLLGAVPVAVFVGLLCHKFVEKPLTRFLARMTSLALPVAKERMTTAR